MNKYRWILLVVMLGFIGMGLETRYLHQVAVTEKLAAWIPTVISLLGGFACLLTFYSGWKPRAIAVIILLLALAAGPAGVYFHTGFHANEMLRIFRSEPDNLLMKTEKGDIAPPPEAPIAISGLALIALIAASGHWSVNKAARVTGETLPRINEEPTA